MPIKFTVFGEPTAKGRPRFARRGKFMAAYTPKETLNAENDFKLQSLKYKPAVPTELPLKVEIIVFRSIPKSWSRKRQEKAVTNEIRPITKPDCDNFGKLVLDAMNGIFFRDDSQVVTLNIEKYYSREPRIEVLIIELTSPAQDVSTEVKDGV